MSQASSVSAGAKQVPVAFCADANYGLYLPVVVQSIIENSSDIYDYVIIVLDCGITQEVREVLTRQIQQRSNFTLNILPIENWLQTHKTAFREKAHLTKATYGRFAIPELCREYDKVIYADIDMVFNRDPAQLMNIDLRENYIAAVEDSTIETGLALGELDSGYFTDIVQMKEPSGYINAGLLLINIKLWMRDKISVKVLRFLVGHNLKFLDQDIINFICQGRIFYLDTGWNILSFHYRANKQQKMAGQSSEGFSPPYNIVSHYNGKIKPWHSFFIPMAERWWYYAARTPFWGCYMRDMRFHPVPGDLYFSLFGLPILKVKNYYDKKIYIIFGIRLAKLEYTKAGFSIFLCGVKFCSISRELT